MPNDVDAVDGLSWQPCGQATIGGPLLRLEQALDRMFVRWGAIWHAAEHRFGPFIAAHTLERCGYFRCFPHLATFPAVLDPAPENLRHLAADGDGVVALPRTTPIRDVLTPAACYHVYLHLAGRTLSRPTYVTTRATCFRREERYEPLARQWAFSMREIVCVGTASEVQRFVADARSMTSDFARRLGLPVAWRTATDPFFEPKRNPAWVAQRLDPVKQELVFDGLALASANLHRAHFGDAFGIRRDAGTAWSACIAFGLERWLLAFLRHFGPPSDAWWRWFE